MVNEHSSVNISVYLVLDTVVISFVCVCVCVYIYRERETERIHICLVDVTKQFFPSS